MKPYAATEGGVRLALRLTPRASHNGVDGIAQDAEGRPLLKLRIVAPPVDGAANEALIAFLAKSCPCARLTSPSGPARPAESKSCILLVTVPPSCKGWMAGWTADRQIHGDMIVLAAMDRIEFCTEHRLSDALALQVFVLRHHLLRRGLVLALFMLGGVTITTLMNGAPLSDSLTDLARNAGLYLAIVVVGLLLIQAVALLLAVLAWRRLVKPRQIRATITADGIIMQKDGFSYGARWVDANLLTEDRSAYLMKFNQLYMRLPKRGFAPGDELRFRSLASAAVPAPANRLADGYS
jgi:hypothetical protein